jgi:YegS/Rv2252/BmrU family lipid kinase
MTTQFQDDLPEICFIVNPMAAKGKATKVARHLRARLPGLKRISEIRETAYQGHATELARATRAAIVVAVGGDGTINEVANGIIGSGRTLGIIPSGSGNDLIKSLNIPVDLDAALQVILDGRTRMIDTGQVRCSGGVSGGADELQEGRYFVNGLGIGFDAAVAARTKEIPYLRGILLYMAAVFQTLGKYQAPEFAVHYDGGVRRFAGLLIAIGNGRCAGGGFYLTPRAKPDDELFDICLVRSIPLLKILRLMPKVMRGAHEGDPDVEFVRTKHVSVDGSLPFFVHADGEIVGRNVSGVQVSLAGEKLLVLVG